jgi:hypothetical protein
MRNKTTFQPKITQHSLNLWVILQSHSGVQSMPCVGSRVFIGYGTVHFDEVDIKILVFWGVPMSSRVCEYQHFRASIFGVTVSWVKI